MRPHLETDLKATAVQFGVKVGALVHPTRLAVTGSNAGPSLYHLLEILGKEKVLARMDQRWRCSNGGTTSVVPLRRDGARPLHFRPRVFQRDRAIENQFARL